MEVTLHEYEFIADRTRLKVSERREERRLTLGFRIYTDRDCRLHWGLGRLGRDWHRPPESYWPVQTEPFNNNAVQTPFALNLQGERTVEVHLDLSQGWRSLPFVLYFPESKRWLNNGRRDFRITLPRPAGIPSARAVLEALSNEGDWRKQNFDLGDDEFLATAVLETKDVLRVLLACDAQGPLLLHWGLAQRFRREWLLPPPQMRPEGSTVFDAKAIRTRFEERDGVRCLEMAFEKGHGGDPLRGIDFVLYQPEENRWLKASGQDMHLPLLEETYEEVSLEADAHKGLAEAIIAAEVGKNSWTLMHRFDLCHDLLAGVEQDEDAFALMFAWLRYSAIRQLDWQRRYNTKPRELAHAQNRLTGRLADIYHTSPENRLWVRLMLGTLGRGGSRGQQVRDEILNIMHRHKVKKAGERFMEEWHQKLHNNTTPDDVVICDAYLAFLESDGDLERFYGVLAQGGVTRERLQSFERPIKTDPFFFPDKKGGLLHDFRNYRSVLKSVHASADLETAVITARGALDDELNRKLDALAPNASAELPEWVRPRDRYKKRQAKQPPEGERVAERRRQHRVLTLLQRAQNIVEIRTELEKRILSATDTGTVRELLYLDLALEEALRVLIEGQNLGTIADETLFTLTHFALESFCRSVAHQELRLCATHFATLLQATTNETGCVLRIKAIVERTVRVLGDWTEAIYARLQPKAEFLGKRLRVEGWTIPLFSEEVIRGGPAFVLSLLLRRMDRVLRTRAGIGGWQVISSAPAAGRVCLVESLLAIQNKRFGEAAVLVTDKVTGEEEIPERVTAILTSDTPDLVSHVAVRARNARVLFATCFEEKTLSDLRSREGRHLVLRVSSGGEVEYKEDNSATDAEQVLPTRRTLRTHRPRFSHWAIPSESFDEATVGGKSNNLNALRGKLPAWVNFPVSMALPFGVFEAILDTPANRPVREKLVDLLTEMPHDPGTRLALVRQSIEELTPPQSLQAALLSTWNRLALPPVAWNPVWRAVTRVWASKWNERAYYSRAARGIVDEDLTMAVLIQQVVEADYAFVIHTVNPLTGSQDELYAEVVVGLGETLVGNYPGRALSFVYRKDNRTFNVLSYPSKSTGLYGGGVIFRSDSNGEDLEDFAGAGLYDSFLAERPTERLLDYTTEPLFHDQRFGEALFSKIAHIAIETEQAFGNPQDIEGGVQQGKFYVVQSRPQVGL